MPRNACGEIFGGFGGLVSYVNQTIELKGPMADWRLQVRLDGNRPYMQVFGDGVDSDTGEPVRWSGRKHWLSPHMTKNEVVRTAWNAVVGAMLHEMQEGFLFNGVRIFDPHVDYEELARLMEHGPLGRDVRPNSIEGV